MQNSRWPWRERHSLGLFEMGSTKQALTCYQSIDCKGGVTAQLHCTGMILSDSSLSQHSLNVTRPAGHPRQPNILSDPITKVTAAALSNILNQPFGLSRAASFCALLRLSEWTIRLIH